MVPDTLINELRERLEEHGAAMVIDGAGRRLYLINARMVQLPHEGLIVAYEGFGTFTFDMVRPVNKYRLVSAGFDLGVSEYVADLVNRITRVGQAPRPSHASKGPKGLTFAPERAKE